MKLKSASLVIVLPSAPALTLTAVLAVGILAGIEAAASDQNMTITVLNERGKEVEGQEVYERNEPAASFLKVFPTFVNNVSYPHSYVRKPAEVRVDIFKGDRFVATKAYNGTISVPVETPGLYKILCSTTVQSDLDVEIEPVESGIIFDGSGNLVVYPRTPSDGIDEKGRFEIYKSEFRNYGGKYSFWHHKRYTYQVISSAVTHVPAGGSDSVLVFLPMDSTSLGALGGGTDTEPWRPVIGELSNIAVSVALVEGVKAIFKETFKERIKDGFGTSLLAANVANVIYCGISGEDDLDAESILTTTLSSSLSYGIVLMVGVSPLSGLAIVIGIATREAVNYVASRIRWELLKDRILDSAIDDWLCVASDSWANNQFLFVNLGADVHNLRLGTASLLGIQEQWECGMAGTLTAGEFFLFTNVSDKWFRGTLLSAPLIIGDLSPIGLNRTVAFQVGYNALAQYTDCPIYIASELASAVPPRIVRQPVSYAALIGESATFSVESESALPMKYQWLHNDAPIPYGGIRFLTLTNLQPADLGTYAVLISNPFGVVISDGAVLSERIAPPRPPTNLRLE